MEKNEVDYSAYSAGRCQYHIVSAPNFPEGDIRTSKTDIG